jgi:glycosyltransferase involved in cell wall biosynthesis
MRVRGGYHPRGFHWMTREAGRALAARPLDYDLVVQAQTLFAPGAPGQLKRPYVIYTDSTHALNARHRYGGMPTRPRPRAERMRLEARTANAAAHVFTMSEFARRSFLEDYGVPPERVTAVGAGANLLLETPPAKPEGQPPRAIIVGYEFERKGGPTVLEAWPAVRAAVPDAELLVVGPPEQPAPAPGVRFAGRVRDRSHLSELYAASTVLVVPTRWDPWGLIYHEAMGHGLPCIGSDRFAVPEIIEDGVTGRVVPPLDAEAVAEALIFFLSDRERAAAMGREAHRRLLAEATWARVVERMTPGIRAASSS